MKPPRRALVPRLQPGNALVFRGSSLGNVDAFGGWSLQDKRVPRLEPGNEGSSWVLSVSAV